MKIEYKEIDKIDDNKNNIKYQEQTNEIKSELKEINKFIN
jgi:hypothetical protein